MNVGIDIGGTKTLIGYKTAAGRLKSDHFPTPLDGPTAVHIIEYRIMQLIGNHKLKSVGIASPGPIDFAKGVIEAPANLPWEDIPLVAQLHDNLKVPVAIENDANLAALAEYENGAGKSANPLLYVTISTGIGTGLIIGGKIYHGAADTEGGHIVINPDGPQCGCGGRGHFEAIASGRAIERRFGRPAYAIKDAGTRDLIARDIAQGLSCLIAITAPERVVLGGGVSVHWNRFKKPLQKWLDELASPLYPRPEIVPAKHVETAALLGAIKLAEGLKKR